MIYVVGDVAKEDLELVMKTVDMYNKDRKGIAVDIILVGSKEISVEDRKVLRASGVSYDDIEDALEYTVEMLDKRLEGKLIGGREILGDDGYHKVVLFTFNMIGKYRKLTLIESVVHEMAHSLQEDFYKSWALKLFGYLGSWAEKEARAESIKFMKKHRREIVELVGSDKWKLARKERFVKVTKVVQCTVIRLYGIVNQYAEMLETLKSKIEKESYKIGIEWRDQ